MDESTGGGSGGAGSPARLTIVDSWLEPLPGAACGENLEYDEEFREMEKAAAGRPAGQFDPEDVPPDWRAVLGHTQSLFERTRDLRVAVYWTRARLRLEGVATLPEGLRLMQGLLSRYWDELHPLPDDGDAYARVNALNEMSSLAGMLGDLRDSLVLDDRSVGELRGRDVEVALGVLEPRSGDVAYSRSTVEQMLRDGVRIEARAARLPGPGPGQGGRAAAADARPRRLRLGARVRPADHDADRHPRRDAGRRRFRRRRRAADAGEGDGEAPRRGGGRSLTGSIESRNDALRAIDMVCEYLERTEPTNPAQLLLRRARKLVNKNFVELVRELAPESLNEVARVMGISAEELPLSRGRNDGKMSGCRQAVRRR